MLRVCWHIVDEPASAWLSESPTSQCELEFKLLKGGFIGDHIWSNKGAIKGDTRSLDYSSCRSAHDFLCYALIRLLKLNELRSIWGCCSPQCRVRLFII